MGACGRPGLGLACKLWQASTPPRAKRSHLSIAAWGAWLGSAWLRSGSIVAGSSSSLHSSDVALSLSPKLFCRIRQATQPSVSRPCHDHAKEARRPVPTFRTSRWRKVGARLLPASESAGTSSSSENVSLQSGSCAFRRTIMRISSGLAERKLTRRMALNVAGSKDANLSCGSSDGGDQSVVQTVPAQHLHPPGRPQCRKPAPPPRGSGPRGCRPGWVVVWQHSVHGGAAPAHRRPNG
jgi:hypothetical protein